MAQSNTRRIVIIDSDKCKPNKCNHECVRQCPVNRNEKHCIDIVDYVGDHDIEDIAQNKKKIAFVSENLCVGCGICVKSCPFHAIRLVNVPIGITSKMTHQYCANSFALHSLPILTPDCVLGILGSNGVGKTTVLNLLGGRLLPNFGKYANPPSEKDILRKYNGIELHQYFNLLFSKQLTISYKSQFIDCIYKAFESSNATVGDIVSTNNEQDQSTFDALKTLLSIDAIWNNKIIDCCGGELQRFVIMFTCISKANVYIFDEPSAYLDIKQRINMCKAIRLLLRPNVYIIVVDHDLAILDYISDRLCLMYGEAGAYGMVSYPFYVKHGINQFIDGYDDHENIRFRTTDISFKLIDDADDSKRVNTYSYPSMEYVIGKFVLRVNQGEFSSSEIVVLLGENGMGKTTLIRLLAGLIDPTKGNKNEIPNLNISYKPQIIAPKFNGTVRELLNDKIGNAVTFPQFQTDVMKPLMIGHLFEKQIKELSGGELQRVALVLALGKPADVYLIDEPSAFLDCEFRIIAAKVIKRFVMHVQKTAFVVEHDLLMASYLASKIIIFSGIPSSESTATMTTTTEGLNEFLMSIDVTVRKDQLNGRPRVNKHGSQKDQDQKKNGCFYAHK